MQFLIQAAFHSHSDCCSASVSSILERRYSITLWKRISQYILQFFYLSGCNIKCEVFISICVRQQINVLFVVLFNLGPVFRFCLFVLLSLNLFLHERMRNRYSRKLVAIVYRGLCISVFENKIPLDRILLVLIQIIQFQQSQVCKGKNTHRAITKISLLVVPQSGGITPEQFYFRSLNEK